MAEQEKTERATPKKRLEARKKGRVAKSQAIVAVAGLLGGVGFLAATATDWAATALDLSANFFSRGFDLQTNVDELSAFVSGAIFAVLGKFSIFALVLVFCIVVSSVLQGGFLFLPNKLAPDFSRLNPFQGITRVFSGGAFLQTLFGIVEIFAIFGVVALVFWRDRETLANVGAASVGEIVAFFFRFFIRLSIQLCVASAVLASVDYLAKRWKYERELRMTPQEIREEMKEEVGDPQIKEKRRAIQRSRSSESAEKPQDERVDV